MTRIIRGLAGLGVAVAVAAVAGVVWANRSVETPKYLVEFVDGAFELRAYPPLVEAQVVRQGSRDTAVRAGFGPLARYIFARDRAGAAIAMTAPVLQEAERTPLPTSRDWTVSFIMPAGFTRADLPAPAGDVRLVEAPPRRLAAVRFSGRWTDANFETATERLLRWIEARRLTVRGPVVYAYYNDPFTPAFLRRNEVLVEVAPAP